MIGYKTIPIGPTGQAVIACPLGFAVRIAAVRFELAAVGAGDQAWISLVCNGLAIAQPCSDMLVAAQAFVTAAIGLAGQTVTFGAADRCSFGLPDLWFTDDVTVMPQITGVGTVTASAGQVAYELKKI